MRSQRKIRTTRDENLEADVPLVIVARFGAFSVDVQCSRFDPHLLRQHIGVSLRRRASFDLRSYEDLVPVPSLDRDAAVLFPIDGDGAAGRQPLFLDFAMTEQSVSVAVFAALQR